MGQNLISSTTLVQTPRIIVKIGNYEFGSYSREGTHIQYPNYVQSLEITKINGQVNTYSLKIEYPITEYNDPNYFEKVFSSVSLSRRIEFTYGDESAPNFMYRNEVGIITRVNSSFDIRNARITYTVAAISQGSLANTGCYSFPAIADTKPSDVIYRILEDKQYGLQDLFTGMRNIELCKEKHLIAINDLPVNLDAQINVSVLEYLQYLVNNMSSVPNTGVLKNSFYIMKFVDDTTDVFQGSYFQVLEVNAKQEHPEAYELEIGYPNANCVLSFNVEQNENYSIYYNYQQQLNPQEYVTRLNAAGEYEEVFAPSISSRNKYYKTTEEDRSWWTKISEFPIKASVQVKGLLRPAILMSYVRLKVLFYGAKHINSGLYVVSKQVDNIDMSGYTTTLNLIRVASDNDEFM